MDRSPASTLATVRSLPVRRPARQLARKPVAASKGMPPESLPARLFLLAYDPAKGRMPTAGKLGPMLRAAALIDLQLNGYLAAEGDRALVRSRHPVSTRPAVRTAPTAIAGAHPLLPHAAIPADPVIAQLFADIRAKSPRKWGHWIARRHGAIIREVRDELERAHLIRVESYRVLGLFPVHRITLRRPLVRRKLVQAETDTLRPARLVTRVDLRDAALVVLAATADLRPVLSKEQRKRHKDRLAQLAVRVGPVVPELRKALQSQHASAAAG
ncbi:Golgi phosphoprotein 3 GPP34 [Kribbella sp. VKM Ac-2527]|uniref:Golgi phosphoprotein 3 GPP34 n=1 Tax=Kribbella caucasensis TaxID=2512215 RepID=A0A4R6KHC5_9ACTN|nr:GPP34 family phosphoprotein [Kribbella sp. VKM Ac-2527]TDO49040.1 Golgi phosphoprotein 3 GPP34 [Kribbella sp. VKM Ac-2527]